MTKQEFEAFIAAGAKTEAGFAIDPATLVYNNDPAGNFVSVRGTVLNVDPRLLGIGFLAALTNPKPVSQNMIVVWDTNGKPKNASPVLALCAVAAH